MPGNRTFFAPPRNFLRTALSNQSYMEKLPRIIWIYWHQGWDQAPEICQHCLHSWISLNPGWEVRALDQYSLNQYVDISQAIPGINMLDINLTARSDIIRMVLMERYGGIWADSTLLCRIPLDSWIGQLENHDFFAFFLDRPNRVVSTWFLIAGPGSYIIREWYKQAIRYWQYRERNGSYFWLHEQFSVLLENDARFQSYWEAIPKISSSGPHFFFPYVEKFFQPATDKAIQSIRRLYAPVFKLTYKYDQEKNRTGTLLEYILKNHIPYKSAKILVAWYGSFNRSGTIGDYFSVKALLHFLTGKNYQYDCASHTKYPGLKGNIIDLAQANPDDYQALLFCCGPVIKGHPDLEKLFATFSSHQKVGISVSLFPKDHFNYFNPFDRILAREGGQRDYGDLAILNNYPEKKTKKRKDFRVGLVLRGAQSEYGEENCLHEEAAAELTRLAEYLIRKNTTLKQKIGRWILKYDRIIRIDHMLDQVEGNPENIVKLYRKCDIILTTRFHGSIIALMTGTPVIALDQIRGGAKVYHLLHKIGYPLVYRADQLDMVEVKEAAIKLLNGDYDPLIRESIQKTRDGALETLSCLEDALNELEGLA